MGFSFGGSKQKQTENVNQNTTQTFTPDAGFMNLLNPILEQGRAYISQGYQGVTPDQIASFQNPYQSGVIDTTNAAIRRQGDVASNDINSRAAAAGAFGGSGWGVLRGENERAVNDAIAASTASLQSQGYNQALSAAMQEAQNRAGFQLNSLGSYGNLLGLLGNWGTTTGNVQGTTNRKGSGSNWGIAGYL